MGTSFSSPSKSSEPGPGPGAEAEAEAEAEAGAEATDTDATNTTGAEAVATAESASPSTPTRRSARERTQADILSSTFIPQTRRDRQQQTDSPTRFVKRWDHHFEALEKYKQSHGDCRVPPSYKTDDDIALGKWVENQKGFHKRKRLLLERYERLEKLGVDFGKKSMNDDDLTAPASLDVDNTPIKKATAVSAVMEERWERYRQQLISYKNKKGNCNVPSTYKKNLPLAKWVENQRMFFRQNRVSEERIQLLQEIGFEFGASKEDKWDLHLQELVQYKQKYKHCEVPQKYKANPTLGRWVTRQRQKLRSNKLPDERFEKLNDVGFWE